VSFSGTLTVSASGVSKSQLEGGVKKVLANEYDVEEAAVTVVATESRRLHAAERKLAGTWAVAFTIAVPETKVKAAEEKTASLSTNSDNVVATLKNELLELGVPPATLQALTVSGFTVSKVVTAVPTPAPNVTEPPVTTTALDGGEIQASKAEGMVHKATFLPATFVALITSSMHLL